MSFDDIVSAPVPSFIKLLTISISDGCASESSELNKWGGLVVDWWPREVNGQGNCARFHEQVAETVCAGGRWVRLRLILKNG